MVALRAVRPFVGGEGPCEARRTTSAHAASLTLTVQDQRQQVGVAARFFCGVVLFLVGFGVDSSRRRW